MTHRLTISCLAAAALAIMSMISFDGALAGPDHEGDQEGRRSERDSGSSQNESEPKSQGNEAAGKKAAEASGHTNCGALETAAAKYGLPPGFFRRLIRQESNFDPKAISRAGAMGIAQFMPGTARWRGLSDPF